MLKLCLKFFLKMYVLKVINRIQALGARMFPELKLNRIIRYVVNSVCTP